MPKVSVIIPNYNHADYLPQRIESVLTQSVRDIEVIILDDCSPDNSREVIERYAQQDARIRVVYNQENSGNTFKQWNKGIGYATGEYVWLAESDDYADPRFLEVLLAQLDTTPALGLAYCNSWIVDGASVISTTDKGYLHSVDPHQWQHSFVCDGVDLVKSYMSFVCVIPNASAVVIRRAVLTEVGPADTSCKLVGDWLYWGRILAVTQVAYVAEKLNYFRQHTNNVRSRVKGGTEMLEFSYVVSQMRQYGEPDTEIYERAMARNFERWFYIMIYSNYGFKNHLQIYRNFALGNRNFKKDFFKSFAQFLYKKRFNGVKHIIGGKILKLSSYFPPYWVSV